MHLKFNWPQIHRNRSELSQLLKTNCVLINGAPDPWLISKKHLGKWAISCKQRKLHMRVPTRGP